MAHADDLTKVPHNVEIPLSVKNRVKKYARDRGISQTAATTLLLDQALIAEGYPGRRAR